MAAVIISARFPIAVRDFRDHCMGTLRWDVNFRRTVVRGLNCSGSGSLETTLLCCAVLTRGVLGFATRAEDASDAVSFNVVCFFAMVPIDYSPVMQHARKEMLYLMYSSNRCAGCQRGLGVPKVKLRFQF